MTSMKDTMWHTIAKEEALHQLQVDPTRGLTAEEAKRRLAASGPNKLKGQKKKTVFQLFFAQLRDWLIYVLFAAVAITLFMGEYIDAVIILLVITLNAVLGVIQEVKAGNAIEALQKMSTPRALVRRDGIVKEVDSEALVPGDLLILDTGRFVAADIRLTEAANLQIEESAMTGESVPSQKDASLLLDEETSLGDRKNLAFMGSLVTYGRGMGVVVATGMETEMGKIAGMIGEEEEEKTPLEKRLNELGKILGKLAIGICLFIFVVSVLQGRDLAEMFLTSVSLAVASIPEGLAAIVAVVLSVGVTNMSKRNAIIRRLPAVETLGSVNIVCSDKTGTLTQNTMTVVSYYTVDEEVSVPENREGTPQSRLLAKAMILCSDATLENGEGTGDPTEIALLVLGDHLGLDRNRLATDTRRVGEFAFDSERKLMSTLIEEDGRLTVYTKGAIDNLLQIATHVLAEGQPVPMTEEYREKFNKATERMSDNALRTLGAAYKPVSHILEPEEMEKDLILIGIVGMIDPPREEVKLSVKQARQAGVTTVMITGDHKHTAYAIARDLGIARTIDEAITGQEMDALSDEELTTRIPEFRVFARVSPEHKVKIVRALKDHGNTVSMTGDGVNDAPSLNAADIGVAMGITGTDVARGASDMVLVDDNFATIVSAIEQGRNIYNNIKKSVLFLLTSNLGEVISMFVALMAGMAAPFLATQLLWINLLTDSLPAVALGMDPGDPDVMKEKPRDPKESFFAHGAGFRTVLGGIIIGLVTLLAFWYGYHEQGYSPFDDQVPEDALAYARSLAFMTIISCQLFYSLALRSPKRSVFSSRIFSNKYLIGAIVLGLTLQLLVIAIPVMQKAFKLQMLDLRAWIMVIVLGLIPLAATEVHKLVMKLNTRGEDGVANR
ncbi:MAG: cation-translocating P-type ATPase [Mangrovibacterium sp.]|nr:cation-translocating P-type ATPase [Mangrovibacterium sp.]